MRIAEEIDQETLARKQTELRDRLASITLQLEVVDRSRSELADLGRAKCLNFRKRCPTSGLQRTMS